MHDRNVIFYEQQANGHHQELLRDAEASRLDALASGESRQARRQHLRSALRIRLQGVAAKVRAVVTQRPELEWR